MTPSELKAKVDALGSHFFQRETMKAFGDTMRNYGVRKVVIESWTDTAVECWELYRRRPVMWGSTQSAYFSCDDFRRVFPKKDDDSNDF